MLVSAGPPSPPSRRQYRSIDRSMVAFSTHFKCWWMMAGWIGDRDGGMPTGTAACRQGRRHADRDGGMPTGTAACRHQNSNF
eukprot:gene12874-biopygen15536